MSSPVSSLSGDSDEEDDEEDDEDDNEVYTPKLQQGRGRRQGTKSQMPLTPPMSSRTTSALRFGRQPPAFYGSYLDAPEMSRSVSSPGVPGHYRSAANKVTDVFASVAHGNDYSFYRNFMSPNASPLLARPSHDHGDQFSHGDYTNSSVYSSQNSTPLLMQPAQFDQAFQQQFPQHYSMPPSWAVASRQLQFVTSAEMAAESPSVTDAYELDGGPLLMVNGDARFLSGHGQDVQAFVQDTMEYEADLASAYPPQFSQFHNPY